jgi:hypothetical protein
MPTSFKSCTSFGLDGGSGSWKLAFPSTGGGGGAGLSPNTGGGGGTSPVFLADDTSLSVGLIAFGLGPKANSPVPLKGANGLSRPAPSLAFSMACWRVVMGTVSAGAGADVVGVLSQAGEGAETDAVVGPAEAGLAVVAETGPGWSEA